MARSEQRTVEDLRQNVERTRSELTGTVDQLRSKVSETVADFQQRISPDALKAGVVEYVRNRSDDLMERARDNPLAAAAIAAGLAYPLYRFVRTIPGPVFLIGSGLFLMGSPAGQKLNAVTKTLAGSAVDKANAAGEGLRRAGAVASDRLANVGDAASTAFDTVKRSGSDTATHIVGAAVGISGAASAGLDDLSQKSSEALTGGARVVQEASASAAATVVNAAHVAIGHGRDAANKLRAQAVDAPQRIADNFNETLREKPVVVGTLAFGVGMFLAAMLPRSNVEQVVAGGVADAARFGAAQLAAQGMQAARSAASAVISEIVEGANKNAPNAIEPEAGARDLRANIQKLAEAKTPAPERLRQDGDADLTRSVQ